MAAPSPGSSDDGYQTAEEIDVTKLTVEDRGHIIERIITGSNLGDAEVNHEHFLRHLRERLDRVGIDLPKIEVRYDHLNVEAEALPGRIATPSLPNFFLSIIKSLWRIVGGAKKVRTNILSDVSGTLKPRRLTLLLGPPSSGRTTFLRALAGRLSRDLQVSGEITYNGHQMSEFIPQKTSAYVSQYDLQTAELTVRETLDFYRRVQGVGNRYEMLKELTRREKELGIKPETDDDIYLEAIAGMDQSTSFKGVDYMMKFMGLDICADTPIGDAMRRGISGGQKKRVTTGTVTKSAGLPR